MLLLTKIKMDVHEIFGNIKKNFLTKQILKSLNHVEEAGLTHELIMNREIELFEEK
jgi:hypothetical protein